MTNAEFKRKLLETGLFKKVSGKGQYVCKTCPFCGDMKWHMYVKIDQEDDQCPVLIDCKKCNYHGYMPQKFLDYFGLSNLDVPKYRGRRNIGGSGPAKQIALIDPNRDIMTIEAARSYIYERVGVMPTMQDLETFQLIGDPTGYVNAYLGGPTYGLQERVWFRLHNGYMIGRKFTDDGLRWKKRTKDDKDTAGIYVMRGRIDTFETINVCICEGVMDAIGLYYHANIRNAIFIAVMGSNYTLGIKHVIRLGVFGYSVNVRIYKDNDIDVVRIRNCDRKMFKHVYVYHNAIGKDFGVPADQIEFEKYE